MKSRDKSLSQILLSFDVTIIAPKNRTVNGFWNNLLFDQTPQTAEKLIGNNAQYFGGFIVVIAIWNGSLPKLILTFTEEYFENAYKK